MQTTSRIMIVGLPALLVGLLQWGTAVTASAISIDGRTVASLDDRADESSGSSRQSSVQNSYWYDWGWYGAYPRTRYESFGAASPLANLLQQDDRCDDGYTFIEPRGLYVETPGPIILDNSGNLVWMQTLWGQAMDLKVQTFQDKPYLTFWHGTDNGTFGEGYYLMLDQSYQVFKKILPVGGLTGDLHEFRITDKDTALMTIYQKIEADLSYYGKDSGWIFDSIFQEIDLATGELIFEWRSSDHFDPTYSLAPIGGEGTKNLAFDYFHINSIDTDLDDNFIISSRYGCSIICVSRKDGSVLWELGGANSDFTDLSGGAASDFTWNHHASWFDKERNILTVFDNGSNGRQTSAKHSSGLMIELDVKEKTAKLVQAYIAPQKLLSPSQGSVQGLPNGNILVGWGHTAAWTEFTLDGEVLCDTHISPLWFANFGWAKNYRTFKYPWVGRPLSPPDIAMRPNDRALFVSWNGATEVRGWQLQTASATDRDAFRNIGNVIPKTTFETKLKVPKEAKEFVRAVAFDADGKVLGHSLAVSKREKTTATLLEAPSRGTPPEPAMIFLMSLFATFVLCVFVYAFRFSIKRGINWARQRGSSKYTYTRISTTKD